MQYQAVGRHKTGIPVVQARATVGALPQGDSPRAEERTTTVVGGLLDHADFWVVEGEDKFLEEGDLRFYHGAFYRTLDVHGGVVNLRPVSGTWNGVLIGVGHNRAHQNLYRQHLVGDVSVVVNINMDEEVDVDVAFSNVKNANTGTTVVLSKTEWMNLDISVWPTSHYNQNEIKFSFGGSQGGGYSEVAGIFALPEAIGAFGATKQP